MEINPAVVARDEDGQVRGDDLVPGAGARPPQGDRRARTGHVPAADRDNVDVFDAGDERYQHFITGPVVGFLVDDVEAAVAELKAADGELAGPRSDRRGSRSRPTGAWPSRNAQNPFPDRKAPFRGTRRQGYLRRSGEAGDGLIPPPGTGATGPGRP